ncbi:MAG: C39 family peptidase [bacterium]
MKGDKAMKNPIVFIDQLANPNPDKVEEEYGNIKDPNAAKRFGVRIYEEYSYWSWRSCAIANVAMILATEGKLRESLYALVCEALLMDGYAYKNLRGAVDVGWKHSILCKLLEKRGFKTSVLSHLSLKEVQRLLREGKYVVLSIRSESGGHMVLVKEVNESTVLYNDPYSFKNKGGEDVEEAISTFSGKFLGRGIATW